jgi:DNA primase
LHVLDRTAQFYAGQLTAPVLGYLAKRGFPEAFVRQRRIGYAPVSSSSRDLLVRQIREAVRSNETQVLQEGDRGRARGSRQSGWSARLLR